MTAPLAQCISAECASIVPATAFQKASICAALIVLGLFVLAAIVARLDAAPLRHVLLHWLPLSWNCGRCDDEDEAAHQDEQMNLAGALGEARRTSALAVRRERA